MKMMWESLKFPASSKKFSDSLTKIYLKFYICYKFYHYNVVILKYTVLALWWNNLQKILPESVEIRTIW